MISKSRILFIIAGPLLFLIILLAGPFTEMPIPANAVLASTIWIALWWITEAIPIPVTSLLPLILFPLTGAVDIDTTGASYGNKIIFLFLGGFIIALAIEKWNLHKRIALNIIRLVGTNMSRIVLGFMMATSLLSMWISNTATSMLMLPIGLSLVKQLAEAESSIEVRNKFGKALMLGIAYAASIGGIATLIGTPPNLVLAGIIESIYDIDLLFGQWMFFALPLSVLLLFVAWIYLVKIPFPLHQLHFAGGQKEILVQLKKLGKISYEEKMVLAVFILTASAWITRSFWLAKINPAIDDSIIALIGALLLFVIPAKKKEPILDWKTAKHIPWGIILLFGGGLAVAKGFNESGLAEWIASHVSLLQGLSLIALLFIIITIINFLTEITSNLATTAMVLPIIAPIALYIDVHPFVLLFGATIAASCAFMLPVATPPNAVVFSSGYISMKDMIKTGFLMNLVSIVIILLYVYLLLPVVWDIDIHTFPGHLK